MANNKKRAALEKEFLPAALEILETPPSPLGRAIMCTVLLFFISTVVWSYVSHIDVVATARGKLIPLGKVKTVQTREVGIVRAIRVEDGQRVKQGDVLIELDTSEKVADANVLRQRIQKLEQTLPIVTERAEALRVLVEKDLIARVDYLDIEEKRIALERDLSALRYELSKARQQAKWQVLKAPVTGVVQELAVHTLGGVVSTAEPLMVIVPADQRLEVEAFIENKDIGFVWAGQPVEVKLDTFPFTRYGTIDGEVISISDDAIQDENLGLVYATRVSIEKAQMLVDGRNVNLTSGMAVTVEIKTGTRRLIEFFLSPLLRYGKETARER